MKKSLMVAFLLAAAGLAAVLMFMPPRWNVFSSDHANAPLSSSSESSTSPDADNPDASGNSMSPVGASLFQITPDRQRHIGLKTVDVARRTMTKTIRTVGRIEFDETRLTTVNIKYEGWVEKLHADYSGKYVKRGEILAEIYSPEAASTQLEYLNLLKWKDEVPRFQRTIEFEWGDRYGTTGRFITYDPELLVEVARQKFKLWEFTDRDIRQLEKTKEAFRLIPLRSPSSGYVFQKPVFRGTRIAPGDKLFDIVDLSTVWVLADVYEYELPHVKEGMGAHITLSYYPGKSFDSKVDFVYPSLSGNTRAAKVRFVVANPDLILKPQMFADVEMSVNLGERLSVPKEAVIDTGLRQVVYVDVGQGFFEARRVELGARTDELVEILGGVQSGDRVVATSVFLVDSEAKLKGIGE